MQLFKLKTTIHRFESFGDFAKTFALGENDLVITNEFLYEPYMKSCALPCRFIMQEKYGLGEPSDEMMNSMLNDVANLRYTRVIAIGGGTVIDISKLFVLQGLKNVSEAFDRKISLIKEKQLVIIPTTCGTGSEVTNLSIAEIKSRHTKMGLADDTILADDAVIIPELLRGLPFKFYACSAIDALIHAIESYVSPKANPYTRIAAKGQDCRFEKMGEMIMASNFAGIAFGNAGVGAVHALSYPLGGTYHVPHGEANYQFFTEVFKMYQAKNPEGSIAELNKKIGERLNCSPEEVFPELDKLLGCLIEKRPLREYGMKPEEVKGFAESVVKTQQRLLANNYVALTQDEMETIYQTLY